MALDLIAAGFVVAVTVLLFALVAVADRLVKAFLGWRWDRHAQKWLDVQQAKYEQTCEEELQARYQRQMRDSQLEVLWLLPAYGGSERRGPRRCRRPGP